MKLLYFSPASYGGIADYSHEQANALANLGVDVTVLCTPEYPSDKDQKYRRQAILSDLRPAVPIHNKILKKIHYIQVTLSNAKKLSVYATENEFQYILLGSYVEYLAPLWARLFKKLEKQGVVFGAIVHDPVRDFVVGPRWWHYWSVAEAYSFLREAFVHEHITLDTVTLNPKLNLTVLPFGTYQFPSPSKTSQQVRHELNLLYSGIVVLAFGHIRDNKNLNLFIATMPKFKDIYLVVAGKEQSVNERPVSFYQNFAEELNVVDRCRWLIDFHSEEQVANLFAASDYILLTYSASFLSGSSVLSVSSNYQKPCLASSGGGPLKTMVEKYNLGVWVAPDDEQEIYRGLQELLTNPPQPQWERYGRENSWEMNAKLVVEAFMRS